MSLAEQSNLALRRALKWPSHKVVVLPTAMSSWQGLDVWRAQTARKHSLTEAARKTLRAPSIGPLFEATTPVTFVPWEHRQMGNKAARMVANRFRSPSRVAARVWFEPKEVPVEVEVPVEAAAARAAARAAAAATAAAALVLVPVEVEVPVCIKAAHLPVPRAASRDSSWEPVNQESSLVVRHTTSENIRRPSFRATGELLAAAAAARSSRGQSLGASPVVGKARSTPVLLSAPPPPPYPGKGAEAGCELDSAWCGRAMPDVDWGPRPPLPLDLVTGPVLLSRSARRTEPPPRLACAEQGRDQISQARRSLCAARKEPPAAGLDVKLGTACDFFASFAEGLDVNLESGLSPIHKQQSLPSPWSEAIAAPSPTALMELTTRVIGGAKGEARRVAADKLMSSVVRLVAPDDDLLATLIDDEALIATMQSPQPDTPQTLVGAPLATLQSEPDASFGPDASFVTLGLDVTIGPDASFVTVFSQPQAEVGCRRSGLACWEYPMTKREKLDRLWLIAGREVQLQELQAAGNVDRARRGTAAAAQCQAENTSLLEVIGKLQACLAASWRSTRVSKFRRRSQLWSRRHSRALKKRLRQLREEAGEACILNARLQWAQDQLEATKLENLWLRNQLRCGLPVPTKQVLPNFD